MKRNHFITLGVVAIVFGAVTMFQSCSKIGNLLNFNLSMQTQSFNVTIPATGDTSGVITVGPTSTEFNVDSFIKAQTSNQLGAANINSVKLNSVKMVLNNADAANNFQNFESVSASFTSNTNSTPYKVSIPNNPNTFSSTLDLPIDTTVELKSYIGTNFVYYVTGKLRNGTTKPVDATITVTYNVNVRG